MSTLLYVLLMLHTMSDSAYALKALNPWSTSNSDCRASMDRCRFELRATSTMSMFYRGLYRVVATENGILHKYDNASEIFDPEMVITADGYPKLVSSTCQLRGTCVNNNDVN
jgi:hypothetical protein